MKVFDFSVRRKYGVENTALNPASDVRSTYFWAIEVSIAKSVEISSEQI